MVVGEKGAKIMKTLVAFLSVLALCLLIVAPVSAATAVSRDGYYQGIKLCGKVRVVSHGADIKVKIVNSFPDLKVKVVDSFPNRIGEWRFVEYGEDFKVQFVESFPDIKIQYVSSFPGVA